MCNTPVLDRVCRESYNDPAETYAWLKQRGMSIVTLTDHDSIDGAEALRKYGDFFLSEEVTCRMPSGTELHVGVYDITERDHSEIQRRRKDFISLLMHLTERKLFFSVNHVYSGLTGRREAEDFRWLASYFPAFETRNGQMTAKANEGAARLAARLGKIAIGGSDAHAGAGAARTFTEVPGARTVQEFLGGLRAGQGGVHGVHGRWAGLTGDVLSIVGAMLREKPWTICMLPLAALVPFCTAGHWLNEKRFCRKWIAAMEKEEKRPQMLWEIEPTFEANWAS